MKRFTVTFSEEFERRLVELAEAEGISKATVIRNSVALYSYLERELTQGGRKLSITDLDDKVIKEIVLPVIMRNNGLFPKREKNPKKPEPVYGMNLLNTKVQQGAD